MFLEQRRLYYSVVVVGIVHLPAYLLLYDLESR